MEEISLSSFIHNSEEGTDLEEYLLSFCLEKNKEVEYYLHKQAILSEKRSLARTNLLVDSDNDRIIGYYTLTTKLFPFSSDVSRSIRQSLTGSKDSELMQTMLIAQLGRSDDYKGIVSGSEILDYALNSCKIVQRTVGLRLVCLEYQDGNEKLSAFYKDNGFKTIQKNDNGNVMSYVKLDL